MASQNPFLANWVKGAYGMELGLAPMLEQQAARLDDDTVLHQSLSLHLEKTRRHAALLRERLQGMGEDPSTIRAIDPVTAAIGHPNGGKPDTARQIELLDYVAEGFELASYRALQSLAEMLGDQETSSVCEQILVDELAISDALSRRLPHQNDHKETHAAAVEGNVAMAREVFAALNAHDLNLWDKLVGKDYRAEVPAGTRSMDREEHRAWLSNFFEAFPDLRYQLYRVASSGDSAFVEWSASGKHSRALRVLNGHSISPTNKKVKFDGVTILRFQNDKLSHTRVVTDSDNVMRQLGVTPGGEKTASTPPPAARAIVHLEIPALDRRITARFYSQLFDWEYEHMDEPVNYTTFQSGTLRGGFPDASRMNPVAEVLFYAYSKDIDSDLRRAEALGGKIEVPRTEIPGRGYFAILSDPGGNHFGLVNMDRPA